MLVVRIELHSAITGKITEIGTMLIDNIGGSHERGDYRVRVGKKTHAGDIVKVWKKPARTGIVTNYPRLSYNVWRLISRALRAAFPEEK